MGEAAASRSHRAVLRQAGAFAAVGAVGFAVDAGLFLLLHSAGLPVLTARLLAFLPATLVTWWINRSAVFRPGARAGGLWSEYGRYLAVQSGGIAVNFAVFTAVVHLWPAAPALLALACGSGAAMAGNFLGARCLVFRR
jgi:putative flippase GtrA